MNAEAPLREILKRLDDRIAEATQAAAAGRTIDIAALDEEVRSLCDRLDAAPPKAEREAVKAGLARLDGRLGELAELLEKQLSAPDPPSAGPGTAAESYRRAQARK